MTNELTLLKDMLVVQQQKLERLETVVMCGMNKSGVVKSLITQMISPGGLIESHLVYERAKQFGISPKIVNDIRIHLGIESRALPGNTRRTLWVWPVDNHWYVAVKRFLSGGLRKEYDMYRYLRRLGHRKVAGIKKKLLGADNIKTSLIEGDIFWEWYLN